MTYYLVFDRGDGSPLVHATVNEVEMTEETIIVMVKNERGHPLELAFPAKSLRYLSFNVERCVAPFVS